MIANSPVAIMHADLQLCSVPYRMCTRVFGTGRAHVQRSMQQQDALYELYFLHDRRDLLAETAGLINREWPRSLAARPV